MIVKEMQKFEEATVELIRGKDYEADQLRPDLLTGGLKNYICPADLTIIARKAGYDGWSWMGHEDSEKVQAKFRRAI